MKKTFIYGAMATGLLFTACKSDDFLSESGNGTAEKDQTLYVNMNIRGDAGTRAAADDGKPVDGVDFDNGVGESEVSNAYFVFYDQDGNTVGEVVNVTLDNPVNKPNNTGSVEKYYQSVVPVSLYKGENKPTQVVCYINPISPASLQNPLSTIETVTRQQLYSQSGTTKYFAMSNSVYYPGGDTSKPTIAVPVQENQLHQSEADAQAALTAGNGIVDIYVERYASKLKFEVKNTDDYITATSLINNPAEIPVTLTFVPERWALNAACNTSYIVKSFRQESDGSTILPENYTFKQMHDRINAETLSMPSGSTTPVYTGVLGAADAWDWNNASLHRSFWAISPAYFTATYPEVSSDVTADMQASQHYYSFNELTTGTNPKGYAYNDTKDHYFHETTVGARALLSLNPAAAVASVIYVGKYTINVNGTEVDDETTFYTYLKGANGKPLVYFEGAGAQGTSVVNGAESMIRRFIEQASCLFKYDADANEYVRFDITNENDMRTLVAALKVDFPSDAVKGELKLSERYRTLQFKDGAATTGIYVAVNNGYQTIGATDDAANNTISMTTANQTLMQNVGYAVKYDTGAGYFNIPVRHYGWYRNGNLQQESEKLDWSQVRIGDFGMVRNHSYGIQVNNIRGLATGIGGKDNPIVPPSDTNDYYVAYRVNILQWAVLPLQEIDL